MTSVEYQNWSEKNDPMGWVAELREALEDPALQEFEGKGPSQPLSEEAKRAAYNVAVALGRCRVFGVEVPEDLDGTLPTREAVAAAEVAEKYVRNWIEEAKDLPQRWDESDPVEGEQFCCEILENLMDLYFLQASIHESMLEAWESDDPDSAVLDRAVSSLSEVVNKYDEKQPEILAARNSTAARNSDVVINGFLPTIDSELEVQPGRGVQGSSSLVVGRNFGSG